MFQNIILKWSQNFTNSCKKAFGYALFNVNNLGYIVFLNTVHIITFIFFCTHSGRPSHVISGVLPEGYNFFWNHFYCMNLGFSQQIGTICNISPSSEVGFYLKSEHVIHHAPKLIMCYLLKIAEMQNISVVQICQLNCK